MNHNFFLSVLFRNLSLLREILCGICDKDEWPVRLMTIHREMNHYRDPRTVAREITRMSLKKAIIEEITR